MSREKLLKDAQHARRVSKAYVALTLGGRIALLSLIFLIKGIITEASEGISMAEFLEGNQPEEVFTLTDFKMDFGSLKEVSRGVGWQERTL